MINKENWYFPEDFLAKYNIDGASRGNLCISSYAFYIRDEHGDLIYVEVPKIEDTSNVEADAYAILQATTHCGHTHHKNFITHTYSLLMQKILNREWTCPWNLIDSIGNI